MNIDALKEAISFILLSVFAVIDIDKNKNGKVSFTEILSVLTTVGLKFPKFYQSIPEIKAEWQDLDDQEREALLAFFAEEFDLPPEKDRLEVIIERALRIASINYTEIRDLVEEIRA